MPVIALNAVSLIKGRHNNTELIMNTKIMAGIGVLVF